MMIFIHFGEKLGFRADPRIAWNMVMNNKMFSDVVPSASWLEMGHHFLILFGFWTCKLFFFFSVGTSNKDHWLVFWTIFIVPYIGTNNPN